MRTRDKLSAIHFNSPPHLQGLVAAFGETSDISFPLEVVREIAAAVPACAEVVGEGCPPRLRDGELGCGWADNPRASAAARLRASRFRHAGLSWVNSFTRTFGK